MDLDHTSPGPTPVDAGELDQVARLLTGLSPAEAGPCPGVQLSRTRSGHVWTMTDGPMTVDVRGSGSISGLEQPVWLTARVVDYAARVARTEGGCSMAIDDRRALEGAVAATVGGCSALASFDLPDRPSVPCVTPPRPPSVIATAITDMTALRHALEAAAWSPVGVPVSGPPSGVFSVELDTLVISGTDRRGVDRPAEFRLAADTERLVDPAIDCHIRVGLAPLVIVGELLPPGEAIVSLTSSGELWVIAGRCRVVSRGEFRSLEPDELDGVVYLVGRVQGTGEPVLSASGEGPVDGLIVWLESRPDEYDRFGAIDEVHDIVWCAEPQPYGVSTVDE